MSGNGAYGDTPQDTGKNAYREPGEPFDGRPLVIRHRAFWGGQSEELAWLHAVEECRPHGVGVGFEALAVHLRRITEIAGTKPGSGPHNMPTVRLPYPEDVE